MENFFNAPKEAKKVTIDEQYDNLKDNYYKIFAEAAEIIRREVNKFKPESPCKTCIIKNCAFKDFDGTKDRDPFFDYPVGCAYNDWQKQILSFLNGEYRQKLKNTHKNILEKKNEFSCIRCGNCCRLAVSEHSYQQLKQRAFKGDKFSKDFISVFIPFETEEEAKNANPEYFKLLERVSNEQKVYYYYCPKLVNNECSDYENRPDICKTFPYNPLKLLPSTCSFNAWCQEVSKESLLLKAKTDIIDFYKSKLS